MSCTMAARWSSAIVSSSDGREDLLLTQFHTTCRQVIGKLNRRVVSKQLFYIGGEKRTVGARFVSIRICERRDRVRGTGFRQLLIPDTCGYFFPAPAVGSASSTQRN